jgi:hypothetical protein
MVYFGLFLDELLTKTYTFLRAMEIDQAAAGQKDIPAVVPPKTRRQGIGRKLLCFPSPKN